MLETYLAIAPRGWRTFPRVMSSWLSEKIQIKQTLGEIFSIQERTARFSSLSITNPMQPLPSIPPLLKKRPS